MFGKIVLNKFVNLRKKYGIIVVSILTADTKLSKMFRNVDRKLFLNILV